jgi:hypothetical protein
MRDDGLRTARHSRIEHRRDSGVALIMLRPTPRRSFYVTVSRTRDDSGVWCWEIRGKRTPMGVKLREGGFRSHHAAELTGRQALEDFLNGLSMEASSQRRI